MKSKVFILVLITFGFCLHAQEKGGRAKGKPAAKKSEDKCADQKRIIDSCIKQFAFDEARKYYYIARSSEAKAPCDLSGFEPKIRLMNDYRLVNVYYNGTALLNKLSTSEYVIIDSDYKFANCQLKEVNINNEFYSGIFSGQVTDGKPNGKGKIDGTNNIGVKFVYEGNLVNGLAEGFGKVTLPSGDTYEGRWVDGFRNGEGTYTWATRYNGMVFKGEWVKDKVTKGSFFNADGTPNTEYTLSGK